MWITLILLEEFISDVPGHARGHNAAQIEIKFLKDNPKTQILIHQNHIQAGKLWEG